MFKNLWWKWKFRNEVVHSSVYTEGLLWMWDSLHENKRGDRFDRRLRRIYRDMQKMAEKLARNKMR